MKKPETIAVYIAAFPAKTQAHLKKMRATIKKAAPKAEEVMAYGVPTYTWNGNLVHFGGFKTHIGFYPSPSAIAAFKKELAGYKGAKGSVQFPLDKPLPLPLITKMVKFRIKESREKK